LSRFAPKTVTAVPLKVRVTFAPETSVAWKVWDEYFEVSPSRRVESCQAPRKKNAGLASSTVIAILHGQNR
jgi:hypothetical protein